MTRTLRFGTPVLLEMELASRESVRSKIGKAPCSNLGFGPDLKTVQHVNHLTQPSVITAIEPEGNARQLDVVIVFDLVGRR